MSFMDSLTNSPGGSGVYGQPQNDEPDVLNIVKQVKDREMNDFMQKANFMSDLSLKQDRLRKIYDLDGQASPGQQDPSKMNTVMAKDPDAITGYQRAELGMKQQGLNLDSQRLSQQGRLGEEALDIKGKQQELNQQKSDQINAQKTADMERKINEANQRIELAQKALEQRTNNAEAQIEMHKTLAAAVEERHKLEIMQKDEQFKTTSQQHQDAIKVMQDRLKQGANTTTTTEQNLEGTKRTTTTQRGTVGTVTVTGKDGKSYQIPEDKLDDWNENHSGEQ